jgi:hypothetical protein
MIVSIVVVALAATASANIVVNGGFEVPAVAPNTFQPVSNSGFLPSIITPWVVTKTQVDVVHQGFLGPAAEGIQYLDLDGTPGPGGIYQDLMTVPGFTYFLTFDYANHPQTDLQPYEATVDVLDGGLSLLGGPVLLTHTTSVFGNLDWTPFSTSFVAGSEITQLAFDSTAIGGGDAFGGILLDNISVAIPEASSVLCCGLIAGIVGIVTAMRQWRNRTT